MEPTWSTERLPGGEPLSHWREAVDRTPAQALADRLRDLVAVALVEEPAGPRRRTRDALTDQAFGHLEAMLADPALSPRDVARRIAVSPRQLHRMFADRGTTFGRALLERRLNRGHACLIDPSDAGRAIGEIAYEVGFADPSYFTRAFRARYGMSPREVRATVRSYS